MPIIDEFSHCELSIVRTKTDLDFETVLRRLYLALLISVSIVIISNAVKIAALKALAIGLAAVLGVFICIILVAAEMQKEKQIFRICDQHYTGRE